MVCKTILSYWSARPFHLHGQQDQLSFKHIFLQIMMLLSELLLVCKTILSSWSARPFHLLGQPDQLSINHIFLQIMMLLSGLFLVCKTILSSWSARPSHLLGQARPVVHQSYLPADHGASSAGGGVQRQPPSSSHFVVGARTFWEVFFLDNFWLCPEFVPRKGLKGSWEGGVQTKEIWTNSGKSQNFFPEKNL